MSNLLIRGCSSAQFETVAMRFFFQIQLLRVYLCKPQVQSSQYVLSSLNVQLASIPITFSLGTTEQAVQQSALMDISKFSVIPCNFCDEIKSMS